MLEHVWSNWFANWSIESSWLIDIETRFWNINYEIPFTIFMHTIFELLHPFPSSLLLLQTFISLKQSTIQSNAKSQTINPPRLLLESIIISNSNSKPSTNFSIRPFMLGAERSTTKKSGRRNILERKTISHLQFPVVNYRGRKFPAWKFSWSLSMLEEESWKHANISNLTITKRIGLLLTGYRVPINGLLI